MIVIGMMLSSAQYNDLACQQLMPEDFYITDTKIVFNNLQRMYNIGTSPELHLLYQQLRDNGDIEKISNKSFLNECVKYIATADDFEAYVEIVKEKSTRRELIVLANQISDQVPKSEKSVHDLIAEMQDRLFQIEKKQTKNSIVTVRDVLTGVASSDGLSFIDSLQKRQEMRSRPGFNGFVGISTGLRSLDPIINGLCPGNFIVVAARPGVGKTAFICHMCVEIAIKNRIPVGIFTLEMAPEQLIERFVANYCDISQSKIMTGDIGDDFVELSTGVAEMQESPIYYYDGMNININSLVIGAKRMKDLYDIKVLFIDYLQLLSGTSKFKNSDSRVNEIGEISRKLKLLARELEIPVICLSQLNRNVESRADKQPLLSDLRDSGSIEQDADQVILLNRPEMYDPKGRAGVMVVDVCKNRHGSPGKVEFFMDKEFCRLVDYSELLKADLEQARLENEEF